MFLRSERVDDTTVHIVEDTSAVIDISRHIAREKTLEDNDEAFYIINIDALYERFLLWKKELPDIEPFYAVKCNSDELLIRSLVKLGVGFDCASKEEIDIALKAGAAPDQIIYANPCKHRSFLQHANKTGVQMMTFDQKEELDKISKSHDKPQLLIRIGASDPTAQCQLTRKFGVDPVKKAPELLKIAAEMGLNVSGVSFHVGSGSNDPTAYHVALQHTRDLFDYGTRLGHKMSIVDVGGGFTGGDHKIPFEKVAEMIRSSVAELFPEPGIRVIGEPGRFFASRPVSLTVHVTTTTEVTAAFVTGNDDDKENKGYMYYVNDGLFGSFNCILYDHYHPVGKPLEDKEDALYPSTIWGPTCDSADKIEDQKMMRKLSVGDWIFYPEMGAYTTSSASTFNGFQKPTPIHVMSDRIWKLLSL